MTRLLGWEDRLVDAVEAARRRPYALGRHDCALWVIDAVRSLTGEDFGVGIRGKYKSKPAALRLMRQLGGREGPGALRAAVSAVLQREPLPPLRAMRGDPLLWIDPTGEEHLGLCLGAQGAVLGDTGLIFLPLDDFSCAWSV